ncbi:WXG100 family type VII secretion target [Plantactinospora sp. KBS50]|uniref:WXG100 family type VII secretion target n=1 Tax=Plantactinospora sp. KBS50 TaxID=2024580 RepID=UPI000BAAF073|nr:WXG100 family type VII secretion target [Plantactinospora sp. KBS50]ASW57113.1 WXG100 family type VII secretion target [Plantactinospora sp. KBS50]
MEIKYNFPLLNHAADQCSAAAKNLTGELDDLKRGLQPMLASWDGDAQAAYHMRQSEWETAANDLRDLLGKIERSLRDSAMKMQQREHANKAKFGG